MPGLRHLRRRSLRVAVPEHVTRLLLGGNGRVWREGLARIERDVRVVVGGPADVWLTDLTPPPEATAGPHVVLLHEASWVEPDFAAALTEHELAWVGPATASAAAGATRILVPSRAGAAQVAQVAAVAVERFDIVPYGVDAKVWRPRRGGRELLDAAGAAGRPAVLFVGVAHPKKNLGVLRDAVAEVGGVALALVLSPSERADSEALLAAAVAPIDGVPVAAVQTPATAATHTLDDRELAAVMTASACFCLPSLGEGFGLPVAEAMACGAPPVVSDRGALPEVVAGAGIVTGVDAASVACGLREALALGEEARALARARAGELRWDRMAAGWVASLQRAAQEAR